MLASQETVGMTREVYDGPGTDAYRSTKFSATASWLLPGEELYVVGHAAATEYGVVGFFAAKEIVELSMLTFGCNEDSTIDITLTSGPITSVRLFYAGGDFDVMPEDELTHSFVGGKLRITLPTRTKVRIEVNGEAAECLYVHADPLKGAIPAGYITYNGTQTSVGAGACLYFPPGVWTLPAVITGTNPTGAVSAETPPLFPVGAGATVYIDGGAIVIGSFETTNTDNWTIMGPGILSGEWTTNEATEPLTWDQQFACSMIYNAPTGHNHTGCTVLDITILCPPFYAFAGGLNILRDVKVYSFWSDNTDGLKAFGDEDAGSEFYIEYCSVWCGDDAVMVSPWFRTGFVRRNLIVTAGSTDFLIGYWPSDVWMEWDSVTGPIVVEDNTVRLCSEYYALGETEGGAIVQGWVDGWKEQPAAGSSGVTFRRLRILGDENNTLFVTLGPRPYPWGAANRFDNIGRVYNIVFEDVFVETPFAEPSKLLSENATSTVHSVSFSNVTFGETRLTKRNFLDFFELTDSPAAAASRVVSDFVYDISIDGATMTTAVDICNLALSYIGDQAKVTSLLGSDLSVQARHCVRYYPLALASILEMHHWGFATKRVALTEVTDGSDTDSWDYAYVLPADLLRAISVLPPGVGDDYTQTIQVNTGIVSLSYAGAVNPQRYDIEINSDGDRVLYTDQEEATLRYTTTVTDPAQFSSLFIMTLAWQLASMLAGALVKGDQGAAEALRCSKMMAGYLAEARASDGQQRQTTNQHIAPWMMGR
jgi:hypothetical protein